jgi:hypothetical protein
MTVCRNFAPDSLGDDPRVCIACLWHVKDHVDAGLGEWVK